MHGPKGSLKREKFMAELTASLFRNYFGGSWLGKISRNGEYLREIDFIWPKAFGKYSSFGTEEGLKVPSGGGFHDDTLKVIVSGWRQDVKRWYISWYNEFGGYGEMQWTSQQTVNGVNILYGFGHECKQETDDLTNHIISCEMTDQNNFKYTIQSFKKGIIEIEARRIRTAEELRVLMESQVEGIKSFQN